MPLQSRLAQPTPEPLQSRVRIYKPVDLDLENLAARTKSVLDKVAFAWQIEIGAAALCGEDIIVDVGTGSGKTLAFQIPLVLHETDIALWVTPLTALMIDQAASSNLQTVAVCSETLAKHGAKTLYAHILSDRCQEVQVSPEIAISLDFRKEVISKKEFYGRLQAVIIDEAHCISLWGGSFRLDYGELGVLRGRIPRHVPFIVASATLPDHILDDIRTKLQLSANVKMVRMTNARPNVALSCRAMKHSQESFADLRFLIPVGATKAEDIDITLVYCNQRIHCEDAVDHLRFWAEEEGIDPSCIAFYHAKIGEKRKRELEEKLRRGEIRILVCTDAVGMGCDMRNIKHVILWGLPPSFCALVQRAGRAARDFGILGEAIVIVPMSVISKGVTEMEVESALTNVAGGDHMEAENRGEEEMEILARNGIQVAGGNELVHVDDGGIRVSHDSDEDGEEAKEEKQKRKKKTAKNFNSREARFLSLFVSTSNCRRLVWDEFFGNKNKLQLIYPTNTTYSPLPGSRCCDNCEPRLFEVELIRLQSAPTLKRGKKRKLPEATENTIHEDLTKWRDNDLMDKFYPGVFIMSGATILGDDIVEKLAKCGEQIESADELARHIRWLIGIDAETHVLTDIGRELLAKLQEIYRKIDDEATAKDAHLQYLRSLPSTVEPASFYQGSSTQPSARGARANARGAGTRGRQGTARRGRPPGRRARG